MTDDTFVNPELLKRRIAHVEDYFDEAREVPWNYVCRTGDGRFEAIVTHLLDLHDNGGEARERSLGLFDSCDAAVDCIRKYLARIRAANSIRTADGRLDFNRTIQ